MTTRRKSILENGARNPPTLVLGLTAVDSKRVQVSLEIFEAAERLWNSGKQPVAILDDSSEVIRIELA